MKKIEFNELEKISGGTGGFSCYLSGLMSIVMPMPIGVLTHGSDIVACWNN